MGSPSPTTPECPRNRYPIPPADSDPQPGTPRPSQADAVPRGARVVPARASGRGVEGVDEIVLVWYYISGAMLRVTKQTDYGIMLLAYLAAATCERVLSARDVADGTGISLPMVSKILKSLARGGIVESHRGAGGGYRLAQSAEETTLAGVIRALEGPISMVECGAQPGQCDQEPTCPVRVNWTRVNREIERALERVALSEMVSADRRDLIKLGGEPPPEAAVDDRTLQSEGRR